MKRFGDNVFQLLASDTDLAQARRNAQPGRERKYGGGELIAADTDRFCCGYLPVRICIVSPAQHGWQLV